MKTKNNNWKTALKSLGATAVLALTGLTVNAQMNLYFENAGNSPMALATKKTTISKSLPLFNAKMPVNPDALSDYFVTKTDEPLHLEDWMLKENNFSTMSSIETETEPALEIEKWMTNERNFEPVCISLIIESEEELQVENWMLNTKAWKIR